MSSTQRLIDHLEQYLGKIDGGWTTDADGRALSFQMIRFTPNDDWVVFSTLGLSAIPLRSSRISRTICEEILMVVNRRLYDGPVPDILQQVARWRLSSGEPILRGDVISAAGVLFQLSDMSSLYAAPPFVFPAEFASCGDIAIVMLVPIVEGEQRFVHEHGWRRFEEALEDSDVDLLDMNREPIVQ